MRNFRSTVFSLLLLLALATPATAQETVNNGQLGSIVLDAQSGVPNDQIESALTENLRGPVLLASESSTHEYEYMSPCDEISPGDSVTTASTCGEVNIADALRALQMAVGGSYPYWQYQAADVAPAIRRTYLDGTVTFTVGDGRVTIADAVLMLRASVGLEDLEWPERQITFDYFGEESIAGFAARTYINKAVLGNWWYWQSSAFSSAIYADNQEDWFVGIGAVSSNAGVSGPVRLASISYWGPWAYPGIMVDLSTPDGETVPAVYCTDIYDPAGEANMNVMFRWLVPEGRGDGAESGEVQYCDLGKG